MNSCPSGFGELHSHLGAQRARHAFIWQQANFAKGVAARKGRQGQLSSLYYVAVPKIGQLWSYASSQPYKDFPVNAEWTWTLLQADKITTSVARDEFLKGKKD